VLNQPPDRVHHLFNSNGGLRLEYLKQVIMPVGPLWKSAGVRMQGAGIAHQPAGAQAGGHYGDQQADHDQAQWHWRYSVAATSR
jgi:hypothetical protein